MQSIKVNPDKKYSSSYEIHIGRGIADRIALLIAKNHKAGRHVIVTDDNVAPLHGKNFLTVLKNIGLNADIIAFPAGEASKSINTLLDLADKLLKLGADRGTCLIALGGGVVGDMVGFIASIYMRGVPYVQIPTTLVAQVDSAIGGKTAVDLPTGKNLLGTFYQPAAVFVDLSFLETLPAKEFENGLAEIIKYGIIDDEKMFHLLEENMEAVRQKDSTLLVKDCRKNYRRIKKAIVEIDEREQGLRRILNYGHTLGHALEAVSMARRTLAKRRLPRCSSYACVQKRWCAARQLQQASGRYRTADGRNNHRSADGYEKMGTHSFSYIEEALACLCEQRRS